MSKIIVCNGGYRTGSTLTFNICREILTRTQKFEDYLTYGADQDIIDNLFYNVHFNQYHLVKCHLYKPKFPIDDKMKIVYSHRNYLDVAASVKMLMLRKNPALKEIGLAENDWEYVLGLIRDAHNLYLQLTNQKKFLGKNKSLYSSLVHITQRNVYVFPYDYLFLVEEYVYLIKTIHSIAEFMEINITDDQGEDIYEAVNIEATKKIMETIEDDDGADSLTQIRKNHIGKTDGRSNWKEVLPPWIASYIEQEF